VAIRACNRQGVILHWIAASTVFYGCDAVAVEAVGTRLRSLLRAVDARPEFEEIVARIWQTGVPTAFKWPIDLEAGRHLRLCSTLLPAFHNGEACEVFCIDVDITEREQMNPAPRKSEEWPGRILLGDNDGAWNRWLLSRELAMFDAHRTPYGMAGSHANIAQLGETGRSLSLSESRKAAIFSSAVDPIIAMDRNGRIVEFNPAAERTFGYRAGEVIGKSAVALITPADMQRKHQQVLARLLPSDAEGADRADRVELRALRADGTDFPVELTITAIDVGGVPLLIQFVRDISDRKEAEAVLLESEARLRLAAEAAEIGAWDWDVVSNALTCSDRSRALFGLPPEAQIDCALFYSRVHPGDRKRVRAAACAALNARGTGEFAIDARCVRPDGTVRWMSARGRAFFENRRGRRRPRRLIGIVRDITERKQREADLERSNVELRCLSTHLQLAREDERARIARELHDEIGQNLTAIILHFEAMLRCEDRAISMRMEECYAIISQTFKAVHDLSLELRPPQLDISGLPASLRWMLDRQAKASGLSIELSLDPSLGRLPPALEITCFRVAQESVTNAVRHARATRLAVDLFRCGAGLHLIVRDNGCGFDAAEASSEALRGSTFGLVSMRERVQCVGGEFELRSNRGRGTEVHARFSLEGLPEGT
jgi:two-component system sensor histidine kinase UhpB